MDRSTIDEATSVFFGATAENAATDDNANEQ
jgi:hypothetical protein